MKPPPPEGGTQPVRVDGAGAGVTPHVPALDGVRALAILLVIPHNEDLFSHAAGLLLPVAMVAHAGWIGVQLFFVLSGFLITGNLIDSRHADNYYSGFYARRVLRIFPLYFTTLTIGLLVLPAIVTLSPGTLASFRNQFWYWTFLSNWATPFGQEVAFFSHFWSLAVEEQFYVLWPLVVHRLPERRIVLLGGVLAFAALILRATLLAANAPPATAYMFTLCRIDALAVGAAAAALVRMPGGAIWLRAHRRRLMWAALGIALLAAASTHAFAVYHWTTLTYGQALLSAAFALFILYIVTAERSGRDWIDGLLSSGPMRSIGRYSYAMYVLHVPISYLIQSKSFAPLGTFGNVAYVLCIVVLSYLAGAASYHLLEKHFLRMKRWFVPRVTRVPDGSSTDAATTV